jgi:hypothetical protein
LLPAIAGVSFENKETKPDTLTITLALKDVVF